MGKWRFAVFPRRKCKFREKLKKFVSRLRKQNEHWNLLQKLAAQFFSPKCLRSRWISSRKFNSLEMANNSLKNRRIGNSIHREFLIFFLITSQRRTQLARGLEIPATGAPNKPDSFPRKFVTATWKRGAIKQARGIDSNFTATCVTRAVV